SCAGAPAEFRQPGRAGNLTECAGHFGRRLPVAISSHTRSARSGREDGHMPRTTDPNLLATDSNEAVLALLGEASALAGDLEREPDRRDTYPGLQVTVLDNRGICAHSGFCTDRVPSVFHAGGEPFVTPSGGRMDEIVRAARNCPSGALSFAVDGKEARDQV